MMMITHDNRRRRRLHRVAYSGAFSCNIHVLCKPHTVCLVTSLLSGNNHIEASYQMLRIQT